MICDLFAFTILTLSSYKYCEPVASVSIETGIVYWRCDCTKARNNISFVIQENIWKSIPVGER